MLCGVQSKAVFGVMLLKVRLACMKWPFWFSTFLCAILLFLVPDARSASFDCWMAKTRIERLICASEKLSLLDEQVSELYTKAMSRTNDPEEIRRDHKEWLAKERNQCSDRECLIDAYEDRIESLKETLRRPIVERDYSDYEERKSSRQRLARRDGREQGNPEYVGGSWNGRWVKSKIDYDIRSVISIREISPRKIGFRLLAQKGNSSAEIMGEAIVRGGVAYFRDSSKKGACEIEMDLQRKKIQLTASAGCSRYKQGRLRLSGDYKKATHSVQRT